MPSRTDVVLSHSEGGNGCRTSTPTPGLGLSFVHEALYLLSSTGGPVRWVLLMSTVSQMGKPTLAWVTWAAHTQMARKWLGGGVELDFGHLNSGVHSWPLYTKFFLRVEPWVQSANRAEHFSPEIVARNFGCNRGWRLVAPEYLSNILFLLFSR